MFSGFQISHNCSQMNLKQTLLCDFSLIKNQIDLKVDEGIKKKKSLSQYKTKLKNNYEMKINTDKIRPTHFLSHIRHRTTSTQSPSKISLSKRKKSKQTLIQKNSTTRTNSGTINLHSEVINNDFIVNRQINPIYYNNPTKSINQTHFQYQRPMTQNYNKTFNLIQKQKNTTIHRPHSIYHTNNYAYEPQLTNQNIFNEKTYHQRVNKNCILYPMNQILISNRMNQKRVNIQQHQNKFVDINPINKLNTLKSINPNQYSNDRKIGRDENDCCNSNLKMNYSTTETDNSLKKSNGELEEQKRFIKGIDKFVKKSQIGQCLPIIVQQSQYQFRQGSYSKNQNNQKLFKSINPIDSIIMKYEIGQYPSNIRGVSIKSINQLTHKRTSSIKDSSDDAQSQYSQAVFNSSRSRIRHSISNKSGMLQAFKKTNLKKQFSLISNSMTNGSIQYQMSHSKQQISNDGKFF